MTSARPPLPPAGRVVDLGRGRGMSVREAGSGRALVLLHGFPLDHGMWRHQWDLVLAEGRLAGRFRLVVPDFVGFGESHGEPAPTIAAMADDVALLLDRMAIDGAVICGLSMGGYVCQHLATSHRGVVHAAVLVDTKLEGDTPEARATRADLAERVARVGTRIAAEAMVPRLLSRGPGAALDRPSAGSPRRAAVESDLRNTIEATSVATIKAALGALADRPDMTAACATIDIPTLLVVGADDEITPPECLERAARTIPGAELAVLEGCGHMTPLEDPQAFNALLATFLERSPSRR